MELGWHSVENDCLPPLWHRFNFGPVSWVHQVVVGFPLSLGVFLWVPIPVFLPPEMSTSSNFKLIRVCTYMKTSQLKTDGVSSL